MYLHFSSNHFRQVHGKSKMKKAFCEPGNVSFCPPMSIASAFAIDSGDGSLVIKRSPENGGDATYTSVAGLEKDFASGSLHPGDLKAAAAAVMIGLLDRLASEVKSDSRASRARKDLRAFARKSSGKSR